MASPGFACPGSQGEREKRNDSRVIADRLPAFHRRVDRRLGRRKVPLNVKTIGGCGGVSAVVKVFLVGEKKQRGKLPIHTGESSWKVVYGSVRSRAG